MADETPAALDAWTVRRILEWTTGYLKQHGSSSPRLDAEVLLAHARGCPRIKLYTDFAEELPEAVRLKMRGMVKRRANHEPVAYLVGSKEFFSLKFEVTSAVLIPRPDTETLVMETLTLAKPCTAPTILELGTGSGCVVVAIAVHLKAARLTAVDISLEALEVAKRNATQHSVAARIEFVAGDLFEPVAGRTFDFIISNPPYIGLRERESLDKDVRDHEPALALFSGEDGLDVIRRIAGEAARYLNSGGYLLCEISPEQAPAVISLFQLQPEFAAPGVTFNDMEARPRVVCVRKN